MLNEIALYILVFMYACAAVLDIKTRRVPNKFWLPFIALGLVIWGMKIYQEYLNTQEIPVITLLIPLTLSALFYFLWYLGTFGGADAKALMVTTLFLPQWTIQNDLYSLIPEPITLLQNAVILALISAVPLALYQNLKRGNQLKLRSTIEIKMPYQEWLEKENKYALSNRIYTQIKDDGETQLEQQILVAGLKPTPQAEIEPTKKFLEQHEIKTVATVYKNPLMVQLLIATILISQKINLILLLI